jgi:DNA-directed RNA polymerase subunit alpha
MHTEDQDSIWTGFQMPRRMAADPETLTPTYGRFSAQPFERGFGTTVANSLRRAMLSSLEGAAVTAVKIEGVEHEFSSIKGVVEDATDLILNLKQVSFKMYGTEPRTIRISKDSAGEVTAEDIETDGDVEILDPSVHLATVLHGGSLKVEMRLKMGRGYVSADRNFDEDLSTGYIPVDSVHTPVKKVNYTVQAARLGSNTEFDKLTIEVWTDGSVKPEDSIGVAAKLIKDHMSVFIHFEEDTDDFAYSGIEGPRLPRNDQLDRSVDELELSMRSYVCLKNADIRTIRDLVQRSEREMMATKNFGRRSLNEIKEILNGMGLDFGMEFDDQGVPLPGTGGRDAADISPFEEDWDDINDAWIVHQYKSTPQIDHQVEHAQSASVLRAALSALGQPLAESLDPVREIFLEESAARKYITTRYQTLINRKYLNGLSASEKDELDGLKSTLDEMDKPYYEPIIRRLRKLIELRGT